MTQGPLADCRVLELGSMVAGPFCGRLFADFGADVIKVEPPDGDAVRDFGEQFEGHSLTWASIARNKRVIAVDLKKPSGRDVVRRLMAASDLVIENFRPGMLESWGLGYEDMAKAHPRLVMVRVSGFGQTGPYKVRPGFGIVAEALSGLRSLCGDPDRPPARVALPLTDYIAAVYAAFGAMMALHARDRTGRGQCVDASLIESAFSLMEMFIPAYDKLGTVPSRTGTRLPGHSPNNLFPTKDGRHIQIAAGNTAIFRRLARAMGRDDLAADPRFAEAEPRNKNYAALDAEIAAWTQGRGRDEIYKVMLDHDVPAAPIYSVDDLFRDAHLKAREMLVSAPDGEVGGVTVAGIAPKLSGTPGEVRWAGRALGADTRDVLRERLNLAEAEIAKLEAEGAVVCAPPPARAMAGE